MQFKDQLGNTITISKTPQRIISLVPSQTELLIDLGLDERVVGVTKFCVHPYELRAQKTVVGGTKQVNLDKIKGLNPDLIIANKEENTKEMVAQLQKVAPVWVSDVNTLEDSYRLIEQFGVICDVTKAAERLVSQIKSKQRAFEDIMKDVSIVKTIYFIWNEPMMGAGSPTFIDQLLRLNKFENLLDDPPGRYPKVSTNTIKEAEMLLLSSEPFPFKATHVVDFNKTYKKPCVAVDGEYFSWYGSRLLKAFDYFEKLQRSLDRIV
ncbi:MAG: helical backbone metal receptor [Gilvibacter sp.]